MDRSETFADSQNARRETMKRTFGPQIKGGGLPDS